MRSDIEIAHAARLKPIAEIAAKVGAPENPPCILSLSPSPSSSMIFFAVSADRPDGKLILVTAISPTPAGEGKTTTTIGLGDALNRIGKETIICLREPSLGPSFRPEGRRDGRRLRPGRADGRDQPPFHRRFSRHHRRRTISWRRWSTITCIGATRSASTSARVAWRRVIDMNDRALRQIVIGLGGGERIYPRGRFRHHGRLGGDGRLFASRQSLDDLEEQLGRMVVGSSRNLRQRSPTADLNAAAP